MIELYDVLYFSLNIPVPVDNMKYTKEYSKNCISELHSFLKLHEGDMAILIKTEGRKELPPKLVQLHRADKSVITLKHKIYDSEGNFRQYLFESISYVDLYCKKACLQLFGNI